MRYVELPPSPALRGAVACLWILEHGPRARPEVEKILPDGHGELIVNLGAPYRDLDAPPDARQPRSFAVGQITRYLEVVPSGPGAMLGVRFEPAGLRRLVGCAMHELTDRSVDLADLGDRELAGLVDGLRAVSGWPARVALVQQLLLERLTGRAARRPVPDWVETAVGLIQATHGAADLGRVARRAGGSVRSLERRFALDVGLTPKLFARQVRFQRVFRLLESGRPAGWSAIAQAVGCYDQAHLSREFRAFAGESPAAFLRSRHELSDHLTGLGRTAADAQPSRRS